MSTAGRERGTQKKCVAAVAAVALESIVALSGLHDRVRIIWESGCRGVSFMFSR